MMRVLIDRHHSDLTESLYKLFEDRIGATVYVPRGMEWWEEGIWRFGHQLNPDGALAHQFMEGPERDELQPQRELHWVTLPEAMQMDWDVVIASVPDNEPGYKMFAQLKGAKFAVQVGNINQPVLTEDAIILDATGQYPGGVPFTPEWDRTQTFRYQPDTSRQPFDYYGNVQSHPLRVYSFVNLFSLLPCWQDFEAVKTLLPDAEFRVFGHRNPDDFIKPTAAIGLLMAEANWGWHDKVTGDGFGYVIHYWASIGRPLIGHASHYRNQKAGDLWEDGVTCIDLDQHAPDEVAHLMQTADVAAMGTEIHRRLLARLDFQGDAQRVAQALGLLVTA